MGLFKRVPSTALLLLLILQSLSTSLLASTEFSWTFEDTSNLQGWETPGTSAYAEGGRLVLKGSPPKIISPPVYIPSSNTAFVISVKSAYDSIGILGLELEERKTLAVKMFRLRAGEDFGVIRVYNGATLPPEDRVVRFVLQFMPGTGAVEISSIAFRDPGPLETASLIWSDFWEPAFVKSTTINFVSTPRIGGYSLLFFIYLLMAAVIAATIAFSIAGKRRITGAVKTAFTASFAVGALFLAFRADYDWAHIWRDDVRNLSGKDTDERVASAFSFFDPDFGDFYAFITLMKEKTPAGAALRPAVRGEGDHLALIAKYFLLPVRTSAKGKYIWTYKDPVTFDPDSGVLLKDTEVVSGSLRAVVSFEDKGALYEIMGDGAEGGKDSVKAEEGEGEVR